MNTDLQSTPSLKTDVYFRSFLNELEALLHCSGIAPYRQPVTATNSPKENRTEPESSEIHPEVGRVVVYIEEHLTEQLSLEKLADEARLSKYQLIRRFQSARGHTPWQYVLEKRIKKAKEMLEEGVSPGQVAAETGFYDQSHFHRKFKEETGSTPKEYQEKNLLNKN